jgi:surfactin synthase thioesterase subunit
MFADLSRRLDAVARVTTFDLPGRGSAFDQPLLRRMGDAVDRLRGQVAGLPDRGYALFGYSMGALIAFALTRTLAAAKGPRPAALIVAAARAPHLPAREALLHKMDDDALLIELTRYEGTLPELMADAELMELILPRLRSDFELCETFDVQAGDTVPVPIHAFGGQRDEQITPADLAAWMDLSTAPGSYQGLPGGHFFLDGQADVLADRIALILAGTAGSAESAVKHG